MSVSETENLRLENLRLWTQLNRMEQELIRLRQGLGARGVRTTDYGSNSITAALLTIDQFRDTATELAEEFTKLRQGMTDRGIHILPTASTVASILAGYDLIRNQLSECHQKRWGFWSG